MTNLDTVFKSRDIRSEERRVGKDGKKGVLGVFKLFGIVPQNLGKTETLMFGRRSREGVANAFQATDGDCSHEIKRRLLLGRKVMTNLDSVLKSRDILC